MLKFEFHVVLTCYDYSFDFFQPFLNVETTLSLQVTQNQQSRWAHRLWFADQ